MGARAPPRFPVWARRRYRVPMRLAVTVALLAVLIAALILQATTGSAVAARVAVATFLLVLAARLLLLR
jgi:hypothetical protein